MGNKRNFNRQAERKSLCHKGLRQFRDSSASCGWAEQGFEFFFDGFALAQGLADQDCAYTDFDELFDVGSGFYAAFGDEVLFAVDHVGESCGGV